MEADSLSKLGLLLSTGYLETEEVNEDQNNTHERKMNFWEPFFSNLKRLMKIAVVTGWRMDTGFV